MKHCHLDNGPRAVLQHDIYIIVLRASIQCYSEILGSEATREMSMYRFYIGQWCYLKLKFT